MSRCAIVVATAACAAVPHAVAACGAPVPDRVDTLPYGRLDLPVAGGGGRPGTVTGDALQSGSNAFMERKDGRIVFRVPVGAGLATTPHSRFPRSELAEDRTWRMADGCATQAARVVILAQPASGGIVIGQIHQRARIPRPPVELRYVDGTVRADILERNTEEAGRPRLRVQLATGLRLGEPFTYVLALDGTGRLSVSVNGVSRSVQLDPSFDDARLYFKAGCYVQDVNGGAVVGFSGLRIVHTPGD